MKRTRAMVLALSLAVAGMAASSENSRVVFDSPAAPVPAGEIDTLVFADLARQGVKPALCSDAVFVRRVFLDVLGILPSAKEAREFIQDPDGAGKRTRLINQVLERAEYADYWAMKWGDILRIKAEFPVNLWPNAAQAYHRWVRAAIAANQPYDQFARELLTASGSNFRVGPANFYRAAQNRTPEGIATVVALTFMGARAEAWPAERLAGMAVFFSQIGYKPTSEWKEEHVFWDPLGTAKAPGNTAPGRPAVATIAQPPPPAPAAPGQAATSAPASPASNSLVGVFPDGKTLPLPPDRDPRDVFADWLITPENPWFTRAIVNRAWYWLMGRGIIHEPDDIRPENPPGNPALLAYLEREMVAGRYDVKRLLRLILNSQTYQLSSLATGGEAGANPEFARYQLRRLDAEVLIDAINTITGTTDLYTSPIPEPYTYIPADMPAVAIADGSITSPFLALFGRSARATGMESEKDNKPIPAQWLHLLNSSHIQRKLEQSPKLKTILDSGRNQAAMLDELYLTVLSRLPTPEERKVAEGLGQMQTVRPPPPTKDPKTGKVGPAAPAKTVVVKRREDWVDLVWALINSSEFLYRH